MFCAAGQNVPFIGYFDVEFPEYEASLSGCVKTLLLVVPENAWRTLERELGLSTTHLVAANRMDTRHHHHHPSSGQKLAKRILITSSIA